MDFYRQDTRNITYKDFKMTLSLNINIYLPVMDNRLAGYHKLERQKRYLKKNLQILCKLSVQGC